MKKLFRPLKKLNLNVLMIILKYGDMSLFKGINKSIYSFTKSRIIFESVD
jgi:hypothetical protein